MRALVYSDLQATLGHEHCFSDPTKFLQIWRIRKFYGDLHQMYRDRECSCLWDLGDTLDDRSQIDILALDTVLTGLSQFPRDDFSLKLQGNHDHYLRNTKINNRSVFEPYFTVVDQPIAFDYGRMQIACAPYPPNDETLNAFLGSLNRAKPTVLLGHFQLAGCFGHAGQLMTGISLDLIKWVKLGLLGHIHKPQSFGPIHYVGSPFQQNWGEAGEEKRVAIVDISETTGQVSLEWVPLTGYPEYIEVDLDTFMKTVQPDSEHRFRVCLKSPQEASAFYAHPLTSHGDPQYDFDVSACTTETDTEIEGDTWTPENVVRRYVEHNKPRDKNIAISDNEMIEIGIGLLNP